MDRQPPPQRGFVSAQRGPADLDFHPRNPTMHHRQSNLAGNELWKENNMTIDELNRKFGSDGAIRFSAGAGNLPLCTLATPLAKAQVYLHGAHVASYEPAGEKPVLYMSPRSNFISGKPIRGGVPVCLPWFGPKSDDPSAPMHGIARLREWQVLDANRSGNALTLALQLDARSETVFPYDFGAVLRLSLGETLKIELETVNRSDRPMPVTEALHSYFSVSDVREVSITGLEKVRYFDKAAGGEQPPAGREIRFAGETDRVYLDTSATCIIHDPAWARKIEASKSGSKSTVVWNPHAKKAASMQDLGEDTWPNFCCVETANALGNAFTIAPGGIHVMSQTIRVLKG
jgi:glucose-6-phosphate 1-epimerase